MMNATGNGHWLSRAAACVGLLATAATVHGQTVELYVDNDAQTGGDGSSWDAAFRSLAEALDAVNASLPHEPGELHFLKVAQGTYCPGFPTQSRSSTFTVLSGTTIFGGYAGIGAANPDELDPDRFVTVLSGDLQGDDLSGFGNRHDNTYHVLTTGSAYGYARVGGFTIRGGHADGDGADGAGGGVTAPEGFSNIHLQQCRITDNYAIRGGGASVASGSIAFAMCTLDGNLASEGGGAARVHYGYFEFCRFVGNYGGAQGGAIWTELGLLIVNGCAFSGNRAIRGAGIAAALSLVDVSASTFFNTADECAHAILLTNYAHALVRGCIFAGDSPHYAIGSEALLEVRGCLLEHGVEPLRLLSGGTFLGFGNIEASARFVDPLGADGVWGTLDDDLRIRANSLGVDAGAYETPWGPSPDFDLAGLPRVHDDPGMPNIGIGANGAMDIGAYEFQGTSCRADHDGDGVVRVPDLFAYLLDWFARSALADTDRDTVVEVRDLLDYLTAWFAGCA